VHGPLVFGYSISLGAGTRLDTKLGNTMDS